MFGPTPLLKQVTVYWLSVALSLGKPEREHEPDVGVKNRDATDVIEGHICVKRA